MSEITKPSGMNLIWASGGDKLNPGDSKYQSGWAVELPPRQWENFIQNKQDQALAHINQHGVVEWDSETEYQANKSYVQGATGTVYRCILTHTNQDPDTDVTNTYWIIAFASAGDFYTKTEVDSTFLSKAQNLADLTNTANARTNLSVYSQAQTYTKIEVDAKTTVSSTTQAQAWASNTTLLTPLRLAEAFKGSNQSLTRFGYQKLPGGLILQWMSSNESTNSSTYRSFPITFPNTVLCITGSPNDTEYTSHQGGLTITSYTTSGVVFVCGTSFGTSPTQSGFIIALGY